jgi:hypothetical protein
LKKPYLSQILITKPQKPFKTHKYLQPKPFRFPQKRKIHIKKKVKKEEDPY